MLRRNYITLLIRKMKKETNFAAFPQRKTYVAPEINVYHVAHKNIICTSNGQDLYYDNQYQNSFNQG